MDSQVIEEHLVEDKTAGLCWKTKDGELIPVSQMRDSHLRNAALFLMGFGYTHCVANDKRRIVWLTILRKEWARRMLGREDIGPLAKTSFNKTRMLKE